MEVIDVEIGTMFSKEYVSKAIEILRSRVGETPDPEACLNAIEKEIILPNLARINEVTQQENVPKVVAAALLMSILEAVKEFSEEEESSDFIQELTKD